MSMLGALQLQMCDATVQVDSVLMQPVLVCNCSSCNVSAYLGLFGEDQWPLGLQFNENETVMALDSAGNRTSTDVDADPSSFELIPSGFVTAYSVFFAYFATVWCTFSVLSNTATIVVLNHRTMKSTTNFLMTAVACSNLLIGLLYLARAAYFYIARSGDMNTLSYFVATLLWLSVPAMLCIHMIQMWMTVAVTTFRLLYVKCAHRSQELCSIRRATMTLIGITLGCVVLSIPCLVGHKVMLCTDAYPPEMCGVKAGEPNNGSDSGPGPFYTVHFEKEADGQLAIFKTSLLVINSVIAKFLPAVLLCGLSAMLVSTMKDADKRRHHLRQRSEREAARKSLTEGTDERDKKTNRTTRLLVVIAIMFIITYLPQSTLELIGSFYEVVQTNIGDKLGDVIDTLSLLNSGMTFILYCFMSQQFRTVFSQVFIEPIVLLRQADSKGHGVSSGSRHQASHNSAKMRQSSIANNLAGKTDASDDTLASKTPTALRSDRLDANNNVSTNGNLDAEFANGGAAKRQLKVTVAESPQSGDRPQFV